MSSAAANWSASIQRRWAALTLPRAKLQKSHAALQELVTATLHRAGPPWPISLSMSQVFDEAVVMADRLRPVRQLEGSLPKSQKLDAIARGKGGEQGIAPEAKAFVFTSRGAPRTEGDRGLRGGACADRAGGCTSRVCRPPCAATLLLACRNRVPRHCRPGRANIWTRSRRGPQRLRAECAPRALAP